MRRIAVLVAAAVIAGLTFVPLSAEAAVRRTITAQYSTTSLPVGSSFTISGRVTKTPKGTIVRIEQRVGSTWKLVSAIRTSNKAGNYAVRSMKASTAGQFVYRARVAKTKKLGQAVSPARTVTAYWAKGTFQNPHRVLDLVTIPGWQIRVFPADFDAWPEIEPQNPYNDPPLAGNSYVMVQVSFTRTGSTPGTPKDSMSLEFVNSANRSYAGSSGCGVLPQSYQQIENLPPGQTATANMCSEIPTSAARSGFWRAFSWDSPGYKYVKVG